MVGPHRSVRPLRVRRGLAVRRLEPLGLQLTVLRSLAHRDLPADSVSAGRSLCSRSRLRRRGGTRQLLLGGSALNVVSLPEIVDQALDRLVEPAAGGKQTRSPQLKRNLIACLIGLSKNLGPNGMAASCGIPYDVLAWTAEWCIREETLREANIYLVNYHHKMPMTAMFGSGTLSSSDGQRLPSGCERPRRTPVRRSARLRRPQQLPVAPCR
ncbi:Tn3 family transposase [Streptomyces anulatus]|uniref:Tn3 family transposase n=1 Tax=Streptomyces anulatus TaxID=1892 RepID=UPI0036A3EF7A